MFVKEGNLSFAPCGMLGMSVVCVAHGPEFTSSQEDVSFWCLNKKTGFQCLVSDD